MGSLKKYYRHCERSEAISEIASSACRLLAMTCFLLLPLLSISCSNVPKPIEYKPLPNFPIEMKVDFGPAGKQVYSETLPVEKDTTPKEAVSQVFPILSGKSCCSLREVISIDGVKVDSEKGRWWICLVNNSKNVSPQKYKLKKGDRVEWKYIEDKK